MSKTTNMLEAALELAAKKIPVFPCKPNGEKRKAPLTHNGFQDASIASNRIRQWWKKYTDAAIGVPTGKVSGLAVVDIDVRAGKDGRKSLTALSIPIPATSIAYTPSGGLHYYFANPEVGMRTTAGVLGPGIDTRGDGGYVIVPPSRIEGGEYKWKSGGSAFDRKPPFPPADLLSRLQSNMRAGRFTYGSPVPIGERNDCMTYVAGNLLREKTSLPVELASDLLHALNRYRCRPPLPDEEVDSILNSIARKILRGRA